MSGCHRVEGCDDPRIAAFGLVMDVRFLLSCRLAPVMARHGIAERDFDAVLQLARSPDGQLRMSDLAAKTGMSTSGMTRVVDRLERQELVTRHPHPTDRRASIVGLTEDGVARLRELMPDLHAAIDQWFTARLSDTQREQVLGGLGLVREALLDSSETEPPAGAFGSPGHC
ncbi:MarR family transcriptional regulator [Spiractinospora alimapuensis]|uniref:MarR family winged helix-turn-helix transcriptional regulator n=1 Tax=Spiractinospora alimapuensis TaxID=2820884 RepID=UPI001F1F7EE0|nr:MarR family transcriptional regulator [Spiractinospora alimapuensis]QVQ50639.1 MarR family transcriptional regulator [Spiractinospora alimapuensis]